MNLHRATGVSSPENWNSLMMTRTHLMTGFWLEHWFRLFSSHLLTKPGENDDKFTQLGFYPFPWESSENKQKNKLYQTCDGQSGIKSSSSSSSIGKTKMTVLLSFDVLPRRPMKFTQIGSFPFWSDPDFNTNKKHPGTKNPPTASEVEIFFGGAHPKNVTTKNSARFFQVHLKEKKLLCSKKKLRKLFFNKMSNPQKNNMFSSSRNWPLILGSQKKSTAKGHVFPDISRMPPSSLRLFLSYEKNILFHDTLSSLRRILMIPSSIISLHPFMNLGSFQTQLGSTIGRVKL